MQRGTLCITDLNRISELIGYGVFGTEIGKNEGGDTRVHRKNKGDVGLAAGFVDSSDFDFGKKNG